MSEVTDSESQQQEAMGEDDRGGDRDKGEATVDDQGTVEEEAEQQTPTTAKQAGHTQKHQVFRKEEMTPFQAYVVSALKEDTAAEDEDVLFCKNIIPVLKRLPLAKKATVKLQIHQILYNAEFSCEYHEIKRIYVTLWVWFGFSLLLCLYRGISFCLSPVSRLHSCSPVTSVCLFTLNSLPRLARHVFDCFRV